MSALVSNSQQPLASPFKIAERDILAELLADKRSPETRRAYAKDLKDFFNAIASSDPSPTLIRQFLELERFTAISLVLQYKAQMIDRGLKEATVNRRLAAVKSLCKYAQRIGKCNWSLEEVEGERIKQYRDTTGVDTEAYKKILAIPDRTTIKGKRDYAILRLLWENVLRRGEIAKANVEDFDPESKTLAILGKGRGTQKEIVSLSAPAVEAIVLWLSIRKDVVPREPRHPVVRGTHSQSDPLFTALDNAHKGHRLTGNAIYDLVKDYSAAAGIKKRMSPHRVRHSGITAALDATGGNVRQVQKLSRHSKLDVILIYDDSRQSLQKEVTNTLSNLID